MQTKYKIRQALPEDEKEILKIAREVTDQFTRTYLGDEAVDWYIASGCCDNDIKKDVSNMLLLAEDEKIIGMMIWHGDLLHLLMMDTLYHGTGAAQYFCGEILPEKLKEFKKIRLECFDKNVRANSFYKKTGWIEYDRIQDEMTGGNRVLYMQVE